MCFVFRLTSRVIQPLWSIFFRSGVTQCKLSLVFLEWKDSPKTQAEFERLFSPLSIPSGWLVHKGNFCKWGNPSGISAAPSPNNTVGSSHCGMLGSLWLVYRVYRILCCLWNVVVGNLLCNSWNTIPCEVILATVMWFSYCIAEWWWGIL